MTVQHDFIPRSVTFPSSCVQCRRPREDARHTGVERRDGVPPELWREPKPEPERVCRVCGCAETGACVREARLGETATLSYHGTGFVTCGWAEKDLCTACSGTDPGQWRQPVKAAD